MVELLIAGGGPAVAAACQAASHVAVIQQNVPSRQQLKVLFYISEHGSTRDELHKKSGISITSLCARLKELVDMGEIETASTRLNPETKRNVAVYYKVNQTA